MNRHPVPRYDTGPSRAAMLLANLLIVLVLLVMVVLERFQPDLFIRSVQEDEWLEWSTFWAFALAGLVFLQQGIRRLREQGVAAAWFVLGLALFCVWVALEEISWGQRVFAYRPPTYFLARNYQQEFNLHNVVASDLRVLALKLVILGYGVVLPLFYWPAAGRRLLDRLGVVPPSASLIPAFLITYLLYEVYPWGYTGEVTELMLGLGFLFAALTLPGPFQRSWPGLSIGFVLTFVLGAATAVGLELLRGDHAQRVAAAQTESVALARDFTRLVEDGQYQAACDSHVRIYSYRRQMQAEALDQGAFQALTSQGLPQDRADYFLDPWNLPYWLRDDCREDGMRRVYVYSFGPDRSRQSDSTIAGDDVGQVVVEVRRR